MKNHSYNGEIQERKNGLNTYVETNDQISILKITKEPSTNQKIPRL
jgi:hypothetical protein